MVLGALFVAKSVDVDTQELARLFSLAENSLKSNLEVFSMMAQYFRDIMYYVMDIASRCRFSSIMDKVPCFQNHTVLQEKRSPLS